MSADGARIVGRIASGAPHRAQAGEMRCSVGMDGLYSMLPDIAGESSLQALLFGVRYLGAMLTDFCEQGGTILRPRAASEATPSDESEVEVLMSSLFGPLVR